MPGTEAPIGFYDSGVGGLRVRDAVWPEVPFVG